MTRLTLEAKETIVKKAISRNGQNIKQIARENNVGYSTLQKWLKLKRDGHSLESKSCGRPSNTEEQTPPLKHLLATAKLDDAAISAYCREQGIYSFQLKQWQNELMKSSDGKTKQDKERNEIKSLRIEIKRLKQDLHRKDKALAETSALLVLKKKADLIWGDPEDD